MYSEYILIFMRFGCCLPLLLHDNPLSPEHKRRTTNTHTRNIVSVHLHTNIIDATFVFMCPPLTRPHHAQANSGPRLRGRFVRVSVFLLLLLSLLLQLVLCV